MWTFVLQGEIRYFADGLYPVQQFFDVDFVSGDITVKSSVLNDALLTTTYFMKLVAYDTAYPTLRGTATATIYVNRNPNEPQFVNQFCRATISETNPIGSMVFNATAVDIDGVSSHSFIAKYVPTRSVT